MGSNLLDQYSYLHFAVGIIFYFWGISLKNWIVIHIFFELIENTFYGINFIDNYITWWPGGKIKSDAIINQIGDVFIGSIGWITAYYIDKLGIEYDWNIGHISIK